MRDGDRVASLLRWCDARGAAYSPSAAVAALALAGRATAARARAAASNVDAVAAALTADGVSPHLAALHAAQRTGALDLHGLDPSGRRGPSHWCSTTATFFLKTIVLITGRGKHSQKGSVVKREVHELLTRRGALFVEERRGGGPLTDEAECALARRAARAARTWRRAASSPCSWRTRPKRPRATSWTMIARGGRRRRRRPLRRPYRRFRWCSRRVPTSRIGRPEQGVDLLVLDGAPSDLLAFALERAARCHGISGAALTVVQCVSNEAQVAAAVDAGDDAVVAGDSATWATARRLRPRVVRTTRGRTSRP